MIDICWLDKTFPGKVGDVIVRDKYIIVDMIAPNYRYNLRVRIAR